MSGHPDGSLLILLVGSNPLPNYLSACAMRPAKIALVYTKETTEAKNSLKKVLRRILGDAVDFVNPDPFVQDAASAMEVQRALVDLLSSRGDAQEIWLNYTGGTKVMATHARMAFREKGGRPEHASYLDDGGPGQQPRLRFDNGTSKPLAEYPNVPLSLEMILELHGVRVQTPVPISPAPTIDDARAILCKVLVDVNLAKVLYCERKRLEEHDNPSQFLSQPFRADRFGLMLCLLQFPTEEQLDALRNRDERKSWFKQWYKFIGGEWLEMWVADQIRKTGLNPTPEIAVGFDAFRGTQEAQLEVDIAIIRGHRSYFVSCTTDTTKAICKSKLFEIAVRARQLGGDLARPALVCLADDKVVNQLRREVDDRSNPDSNIRIPGVADVRVFGLSDVRSWSDCDGKQPNRHSLKTWLES